VLLKSWGFLRPNFIKLAMLVLVMSMTMLVITDQQATSKVTWNQERGLPLPFLTLGKYQGPCPPSDACTRVFIQRLHPLELLLDFLGWYVVSCVLFWACQRRFFHRRSISSL
jgi:hypothetical protein